MVEIMTLSRDEYGFLIGDVSDLYGFLPFDVHDANHDTWEHVDDDNFLDWSCDLDCKPRYDKIRFDKTLDERCEKYRKIFDGWDDLSFAEKRDRINNYRCGF